LTSTKQDHKFVDEVIALLLVAANERMIWSTTQWQNFRSVLQALVSPPANGDDDVDTSHVVFRTQVVYVRMRA
jgi:hypothetical protein